MVIWRCNRRHRQQQNDVPEQQPSVGEFLRPYLSAAHAYVHRAQFARLGAAGGKACVSRSSIDPFRPRTTSSTRNEVQDDPDNGRDPTLTEGQPDRWVSRRRNQTRREVPARRRDLRRG